MGICLSAPTKDEAPSCSSVDLHDPKSDGNEATKVIIVVPPASRTEGEILGASNLKNFTFSDLKSATGNFHPDSILGEGGFGLVFKGWIDEDSLVPATPSTGGMNVAIKRLSLDGLQGHREWLTEVNYLGRLCHPNLVKLIGYCLEDDHRLLVYEFMPLGCLENHLFTRGGGSAFKPLSWELRLKIALGAAKGLAFLHEANIIYRDLKTSNVLLDSSYNAKLSDFGLARDGPTDDQSHVSTRVMGTYGYAAPEYVETGHLTARSDVYSYGVVLLEMLCGRGVIECYRSREEHNLIDWSKPYLEDKRKICRVLDNRLEGQYSLNAAHKVAHLAVRCLSLKANSRPRMNEVVRMLRGDTITFKGNNLMKCVKKKKF